LLNEKTVETVALLTKKASKSKASADFVANYMNEDIKQSIILKLLEEIPNFPMEEAEKRAKEEAADI